MREEFTIIPGESEQLIEMRKALIARLQSQLAATVEPPYRRNGSDDPNDPYNVQIGRRNCLAVIIDHLQRDGVDYTIGAIKRIIEWQYAEDDYFGTRQVGMREIATKTLAAMQEALAAIQ